MLKEFLAKFKSYSKPQKFGTFGGVFTPDVLTILGVIMYLRLGWVVGNAGLLGAILIIILAKSITLCTGLSMSSITTNIRIGAGGAYSIISKSLGLEAGGSVGIPFYISQTLSAALYIIGFTEGFLLIIPIDNPLIISLIVWIVLMVISYLSTDIAIKTQYVILVIIGISILSFLLSPSGPVKEVNLIGKFENADFWHVFAVFFPAVTGIMVGANLSGELKEPRKAIPLGTLSAIGVTLIVYIVMAIAAANFISPEELRSNQMALVDNALIGGLVIVGILAATFSSALGSIVGAPRVLQAMAVNKSVPFSKFFSKRIKAGEPRNAIMFSGIIILIALVLGNLDALASLITMFFLITYGTLNFVVFLHQSMKVISFRPTFKVPRFVPLTGALGCMFVMLLIDPFFSLIAIITIILLYGWLTRRGLQANWGDLRGGMFLALAEQASRLAAKFPRHKIAWKPDILLPIEDPLIWAGSLLFIRNVSYPSGSIFSFSVKSTQVEETREALEKLIQPLKDDKLLVSSVVIEDKDFIHGSKLIMQILRSGAFRPNLIFLSLSSKNQNDPMLLSLIEIAESNNLGIIILRQHPRSAFGLQKEINLWLRDKSPNWHLTVLIALQLQMNWEGKINLVTVAEKKEEIPKYYKFLERLSDHTRLPSLTDFHVLVGGFKDALTTAPRADINIFGLGEVMNLDFMRECPELTNSSCIFIRDSGNESAIV
jgi:solute carrier family 12 sodium/potassium/chloride transporter 2